MKELNLSILDRKHRLNLWMLEFDKIFWFTRGDVLTFSYIGKGYGFSFTGICISVHNKWLHSPNSAFIARNVIGQTVIESSISIYAVHHLRLWVLDHSRKQFKYRAAKLYYLRTKLNQASRVIVA